MRPCTVHTAQPHRSLARTAAAVLASGCTGRLRSTVVVGLVASATALTACTATTPTQSGSGSAVSSSPRIIQPAESGIAALRRRPWLVPRLAPGARCPVTPTKHRPDPELGEVWANGPVGPVGLNAGVLQYQSVDRSDGFTDVAWGAQKIMWAVDPAITTPVLVRGRQLDGPNEVRFGIRQSPSLCWIRSRTRGLIWRGGSIRALRAFAPTVATPTRWTPVEARGRSCSAPSDCTDRRP